MKKLLNKYIPLAYGAYFNVSILFAKQKTVAKAFSLFCTVRNGKVLPNQKEYLDAAKNETDEVLGHTLQSYTWKGKKDTVLLLHGWESNTFRWRNLIAKLKEADYNVVAFDAPAHGYSSGKELNVPLYTECTQYYIEKYRPQHIIAHSVGGMNALYSQYKYPDSSIKKIVTIGSPSELSEIMNQYKTTVKYNTRVERALEDYFMNRFGFRTTEFSTSEFVKTNTKKGFVIHDVLDMVVPFKSSEKVHGNWKDSKLLKTKGLGHSMHQEEINNAIIEFLK
ncbi:pimeloyl-ACP methyl ester carboxylesterase [Saonia flava]|uniref:Pimeloyl-ACP methyl ester carboxylesterase n=1 Tax=Saonia flava TaxID=523696 RepID=A0A846R163_9FLAO|nr:alpha/beta hydrolase [Saonia flava]NJB72692.1 pimeloyl-ACP methyl ester carboxylesterase [Saonia flava]